MSFVDLLGKRRPDLDGSWGVQIHGYLMLGKRLAAGVGKGEALGEHRVKIEDPVGQGFQINRIGGKNYVGDRQELGNGGQGLVVGQHHKRGSSLAYQAHEGVDLQVVRFSADVFLGLGVDRTENEIAGQRAYLGGDMDDVEVSGGQERTQIG
jgi:hypothetical protein